MQRKPYKSFVFIESSTNHFAYNQVEHAGKLLLARPQTTDPSIFFAKRQHISLARLCGFFPT
jgi:hypothetical protein